MLYVVFDKITNHVYYAMFYVLSCSIQYVEYNVFPPVKTHCRKFLCRLSGLLFWSKVSSLLVLWLRTAAWRSRFLIRRDSTRQRNIETRVRSEPQEPEEPSTMNRILLLLCLSCCLLSGKTPSPSSSSSEWKRKYFEKALKWVKKCIKTGLICADILLL